MILKHFITRYFLATPLLFASPADALTIKLFNVGQGNCTVVTQEGQPTLLVDAGSSQYPRDGNGKERTQEIISSIGNYIVEKSDVKELAVIISHPDIDHGNWVEQIVQACLDEEFQLTVLLGGTKSDYEKRTRDLGPAIKRLEKHCEELGFVFNYCEDVANIQQFCRQYLPDYCSILAANWRAADNDKSIVVRVLDNDVSVLLPGDATQSITGSLSTALLESRYLVASHHGAWSHGCNTLEFISKVNPEMIFISNGMNGTYHHIRPETLQAMCQYFKKKKNFTRWDYHTINYYYGDDSILGKTGNCKPVVKYQKGFTTAITLYPIFSTSNAGDIILNTRKDGVITLGTEHESDTQLRKNITFAALPRSYFADYSFKTITQLNLTKLGLTDTDIKNHFNALPEALKIADLSDNKLGHSSINRFAHLLNVRNKATEIFFHLGYENPDKQKYKALEDIVEKEKEDEKVTERTLKSLVRKKVGQNFQTQGKLLIAAKPHAASNRKK